MKINQANILKNNMEVITLLAKRIPFDIKSSIAANQMRSPRK